MDNLFLVLVFLSIFGLIVSLVKPAWLKLKTRKQSLLVFGGGIILFFILFGVTSDAKPAITATPETQNSPVVTNTVPKTEPTAPATPPKPLTLEQQVTNAVIGALGATNNMDKERVVKVKVDTYSSADLKRYGYKTTDKINGVTITINASENLTANLQRGAMAGEAEKIFRAVFPLAPQLGDVAVWSQLPIKDQYGNVKDGLAITFVMSRPVYEKINWENFNHRDLPNLLNREKATDDRNGSHEMIKF